MVGQYSPLDPDQNPPQQGAPPQGTDTGGLLNQWRGFLDDPAGRAALVQTGLQMLQPRAIGQSTLGHIASSIGGGGEAGERVRKTEASEAEAASVQSARERGVGAREDLANAAGQRADAAMIAAQAAQQRAQQGGVWGAQGGVTANQSMQAKLKIQQKIREYLDPGLDVTLPEHDIYMPLIEKKYGKLSKPQIFEKYQEDPEFRTYMQRLFGGDVVPDLDVPLRSKPGSTQGSPEGPPAAHPTARRGMRPDGTPAWFVTNPSTGQHFEVR